MNLMFNALLDLSRLEAGKRSVVTAPMQLAPLLQEVAALYREQATARGLQFRVCLPRTGASVQSDAALLRQALVNLVHNALRYTERGGILIGVRRRGAHWRIEVCDTGIGVATTDAPHIHSPYFRADQAWQSDSAGHGLGLAVVARSARLMGAEHGFRSRLGRGSRFWLQLAAVSAEDQHKHKPVGVTSGPRASQTRLGGCCLIVDDDPHVLTAWSALLAPWGIDGRYVRTGDEARAVLASGFRPHVILCDQRLRSGESGFDVLRALLTLCPGSSGALVSGEFDAPELREAEAEGYVVLHKPLNLDELRAVLAAWLPAAANPLCARAPLSAK